MSWKLSLALALPTTQPKLCCSAGVAIVDEHGAGHAQDMLPQFEAHLESRSDGDAGGSDADDEEAHDRVRECVVVLLGTLARHMDPADPKARP